MSKNADTREEEREKRARIALVIARAVGVVDNVAVVDVVVVVGLVAICLALC